MSVNEFDTKGSLARKAALEREHARELADVSGANARVLADRLKLDGLSAEVREVKVDGKDLPFVAFAADTIRYGSFQCGANHWAVAQRGSASEAAPGDE